MNSEGLTLFQVDLPGTLLFWNYVITSDLIFVQLFLQLIGHPFTQALEVTQTRPKGNEQRKYMKVN